MKLKAITLFLLTSLTSITNAALIDRGSGLAYEDQLNITFFKNAQHPVSGNNYTNWRSATNRVSVYNYSGYNDWRIMSLGEMSYLNDNYFQNQLGTLNIGDITITNLTDSKWYWASDAGGASWRYGYQFGPHDHIGTYSGLTNAFFWTARSGDVVEVALPSGIFLLISGLLGLGLARSRS